MTTTYELYTNENGTPKAVEGKAPAIIERVEALETSVESLEETLDNGVVTSVNGNTGDVTVDVGVTSVNGNTGDITPEQTGCLPIAGGTMTGIIEMDRGTGHIYKKDASGRMVIRGGASSGTDSASVYLNGKDYASNPSTFQVRVADGTNDKSLWCKPDGTLTWDSKNVVRSVNGTNADASGNVKVGATIPNVSGATVTKSIAKNGSFTLPCNAVVMFAVDTYSITTATINGYSVTTKSSKNVKAYFDGADSQSERFYSGFLCIPLPKGAVIKNTAVQVMTILYTPT